MATKSNYGEPSSERSSSMTDDLSNRASEAKQKVSDMARNAADAIDEGRSRAAESLDSAAETLKDRAQTRWRRASVGFAHRQRQARKGGRLRAATTCDECGRRVGSFEESGAVLLIAAAFASCGVAHDPAWAWRFTWPPNDLFCRAPGHRGMSGDSARCASNRMKHRKRCRPWSGRWSVRYAPPPHLPLWTVVTVGLVWPMWAATPSSPPSWASRGGVLGSGMSRMKHVSPTPNEPLRRSRRTAWVIINPQIEVQIDRTLTARIESPRASVGNDGTDCGHTGRSRMRFWVRLPSAAPSRLSRCTR